MILLAVHNIHDLYIPSLYPSRGNTVAPRQRRRSGMLFGFHSCNGQYLKSSKMRTVILSWWLMRVIMWSCELFRILWWTFPYTSVGVKVKTSKSIYSNVFTFSSTSMPSNVYIVVHLHNLMQTDIPFLLTRLFEELSCQVWICSIKTTSQTESKSSVILIAIVKAGG